MKKKCCDWSAQEWAWTGVSEVALYFTLYCPLRWLGASGNLWVNALILLVLINVMFFACPVFRKHYM